MPNSFFSLSHNASYQLLWHDRAQKFQFLWILDNLSFLFLFEIVSKSSPVAPPGLELATQTKMTSASQMSSASRGLELKVHTTTPSFPWLWAALWVLGIEPPPRAALNHWANASTPRFLGFFCWVCFFFLKSYIFYILSVYTSFILCLKLRVCFSFFPGSVQWKSLT